MPPEARPTRVVNKIKVGARPRTCLKLRGAKGGERQMAKSGRGFASMDEKKQREIASKGGKAAHSKGTAHEWNSEEAREAGRKGGKARHRSQ